MHDQDLIQQLDALRPASDDLERLADESVRARLDADPQSRELYTRIQSMDAAVGSAIRQVTPPAGLQQRLLEQLRAVEPASGASDIAPQRPAPAERGPRSRRWWLTTAAALAVAASMAAVLIWKPWSETYVIRDADDLLARAMEFYREDTGRDAERLQDPRVLGMYPISGSVQAAATPRARHVPSFLGREAVAYDLSGPDQSQATLYVWRERLPMLPGSPRVKLLPTGGLWLSAWQENGVAYLLVVQGARGQRKAEDFFLKPLPPTA